MTFISAAFLAGLAAMAVPVIIHLIHRQRYPDRAFPTLRFFDKTVKHNVLQRRLIDRILLLLRVLALMLLALGLSRPFWNSSIGERRMSLVIVLDNSPGMARAREGKPLLERAKTAVADVLKNLGPADRVEIVLTSRPPGVPALTGPRLKEELALRAGQPASLIIEGAAGAGVSVPGMTADTAQLQAAAAKVPAESQAMLSAFDGGHRVEFGYDHDRLAALLDSVKVSSKPGNMQAALLSARTLLAGSADGDRKIVVVSDLRDADWRGEPSKDLAGVDVRFLTMEPDAPIGPNLGIDACTLSQSMAGFGQLVTATLTVHNYGKQASQEDLTLSVVVDGNVPIAVKVPAIPAHSSRLVAVPIHVSGHDRMLCTATVASTTDPFAYDNTWHFQIGVRPPVTALCVNGAAGANGADKATFFVMKALAALATRDGSSASLVDPRQCEVDELKKQKLIDCGVILLADVPALDPDAREKLRQYVSDGGGLLVFGDPAAKADEYNGWPFLPAQVVEQKPKKGFLYIRALAERAPAVADVRRRAGGTIHALTTDDSLSLEPREGATVLATFSDGSPAMVEGRIGKGRVIFVATGCHVSKSEWPLQPAFVLMVRELVQFLGSGGIASAIASDRLAGEGAAMTIVPERAAGTPALFRLEPGTAGPVYKPLAWFRQHDRLVMPEAAEPGQYVLSVRFDAVAGLLSEPGLGAEIVPISVNHDPRLSDLTPATVESVRQHLPEAKVEFEPAGALTAGDLHGGRDLWRVLVVGALVFLLAEGVLAWRWASESS